MKNIDPKLQQCIDACYSTVTACKVCLDTHLGESDMRKCHQLCLDCIDICIACAKICSANSAFIKQVSNACAEICKACGDECSKFDSDVCRECAEQCRTCAEICEKMWTWAKIAHMGDLSFYHSELLFPKRSAPKLHNERRGVNKSNYSAHFQYFNFSRNILYHLHLILFSFGFR